MADKNLKAVASKTLAALTVEISNTQHKIDGLNAIEKQFRDREKEVVTTLVQAGYYPTAGMYLFYAVFVVIGFVVWLRASRTVVDATDTDRGAEAVSA